MIDSRMSRFNAFNSEFEAQLSHHKTHGDAYLATEEKFKLAVGYNQYSGLDSFKTLRSRKFKQKRK